MSDGRTHGGSAASLNPWVTWLRAWAKGLEAMAQALAPTVPSSPPHPAAALRWCIACQGVATTSARGICESCQATPPGPW
jgi:hypothetical protein